MTAYAPGRGVVAAAVAAALAVVVLVLAGWPGGVARGQGPPDVEFVDAFGNDFGVANRTDWLGVSADAFPGSKAWWAGTCDLEGGAFAVGGDPGERLAHCLEHPAGNWLPGDPGELGALPPLVDRDAEACAFLHPDLCNTDQPGVRQPGWLVPPSWRKEPVAQAGAHPDASGSFWLTRTPQAFGAFSGIPPDGDPRDITVGFPAGVVGNPQAVAMCPAGPNLQRVPVVCPPESQVGVATISLGGIRTYAVPVYNVEPRDAKTAEFIISAGYSGAFHSNVPIVARARTDGDFGVDAMVIQAPQGVPLLGQTVTLWGVPWAAEHDAYRPPAGYQGAGDGHQPGMPATGLPGPLLSGQTAADQAPQGWEPSWGPIRPFFANPTECAPQVPETTLELTMWQDPPIDLFPDATGRAFEVAPADALVDGCDRVPFDVDLSLSASSVADAPTGLSAGLDVPQNNDLPFDPPPPGASQPDIDAYVAAAAEHWNHPDGRGLATAHLDKAVVTLPAGFSVNPAGAAGLGACTDAQIGATNPASNPVLFNDDDPFDGTGPTECPAGSVIGTATATSPLLADVLTGQVVLGQPKSTDPTSGQMFRLFLVLRNRERGLVAKIHGTSVANPHTGQLTTTFDHNPRLPIDHVNLQLKGGQRALLATPAGCATNPWSGVFTPWTAAHGGGGAAVPDGASLPTTSRCGSPFSPGFTAGVDNTVAGGSSTLAVKLTRPDGHQTISDVTVNVPDGLLAAVGDVALCTSAQAATGICPAGSRVGTVDAAAGAGLPYFLERKGDAYLTAGYKGAPYGLLVRVPVEAGPFRGPLALDDIVVRQALHVDPTTARVTAVSDPIPQIWHGIPLRARQITVRVDREGFIRNPTDCTPQTFAANLRSPTGTTTTATHPFGVSNCANLAFKPRLRLALKGRRQMRTGRHPALRATLRHNPDQAAIERAEVRLPRSLALDPDNARALCEHADGTRPDPENHCPQGSVIGRARAITPLLARPLTGDVFFVKNIRIDPDTGNEIRTLPMLVVALRGEIAINLHGQSSVKRQKLVNTFANLPDAPIRRFAIRIKGARNGILVVTRTRRHTINICKHPKRHKTQTNLNAQNNKHHDTTTRTKTPCPNTKKKTKRRVRQQRAKQRRNHATTQRNNP